MGALAEFALSEAALSGGWLVLQLAPTDERITGNAWPSVKGESWDSVTGDPWPSVTGER